MQTTPSDTAAIEQGCYWDESAAWEPVDWIESFCRLSDGARAGQKIRLLEWQRKALQQIFGWKQSNGTRRFKRVYITIAKKNAKSTFCSALAAYLLEMDGEDGAYIYLTAVDSDQTSQVFHPCSEMIRRSPDLSRRYRTLPSRNIIKYGENAWIKAISSEAGGSEGLNAHALIIDELHAWDNTEFYDSLHFASIARTQPLEITITTRGSDPDSICGAHEEQFRRVKDGEVEDITLLPIFYCAEPDDDLEDPAVWKKANPALGKIISVVDFKRDWEAAKTGSPRELANFLRRRLNMWQRGFFPFFDVGKWDKLEQYIPDEELSGLPVFTGIDLAARDDLCAISLCFLLNDDRYYLKSYHFTPEEKIRDEELRGRSQYRDWKRDGYLISSAGNVVRRQLVFEKLRELDELYRISDQPIAIDRWQADQLIEDLEAIDFQVFAFGQGFKSMSLPTKEFDMAIKDGFLLHDENPLMTWQIQNAVVAEDAHENIKIIKKSGTREKLKRYKVDGVVASVMAIDCAMRYRGGSFAESGSKIAVVTL
jgi:phage terminase large subunit-like protein